MTAGTGTGTGTAGDDASRLVALQLGNLYALLFMLGVGVLHATSELRVVRAYLAAAAVADVGHVGLTCWVLGAARALDVFAWNAVTWGNIGFTVSCLLFYSFLLYFCVCPGRTQISTPISGVVGPRFVKCLLRRWRV